jgi:hypothetical protein
MAGAMMVAPTAGLLMAATPALAKDRFAYEVKESRAYAYKTSLNKTEIEVLNIVIPCDEQTDEYNCDYARYAHEPNCPDKITFGPTGKVPLPKPPKKAEPFKGGAGDSVGGEEPPQGPPVRLNFYLSLASLSRVPGSKDSTGIGAKEYVDLSGAREPNVFTNTDAFTQNQRSYEERCWPKKEAKTGNDFSHVMSRSEKSLHTYHYSECYRRDCTFTAPSPGSLGATAEHARSITDVREVHGRVIGRMSSVVEDLNWGDGAITADSVTSYIKYVADGTPGGLKWEVSSSAQGVKVGGQPVTLPPGTVVSLPNGSSFGMAAPYVDAAKDGSSLTIIHGGLTIATTDQAAFFAGGEVYASFGSSPDDSFNYPDPQPEDNTGIGGGGSIDSGGGLGGGTTDLGGGDITTTGGGGGTGGEEGTAAGPGGELLVFTVATGRGGVTSILVLAGLALLLMASRWVQRFPWGRGLAKVFPFKLIDWIYRAFVKT